MSLVSIEQWYEFFSSRDILMYITRIKMAEILLKKFSVIDFNFKNNLLLFE